MRAVQACRGEAFGKALEAGSWRPVVGIPLLDASLSRSQALNPARSTYSNVFPTHADLRRAGPGVVRLSVRVRGWGQGQHHPVQNRPEKFEKGGVVGDCSMAARLKGAKTSRSSSTCLTTRSVTSSARLSTTSETMFLTVQGPLPDRADRCSRPA